MFSRNIIRDGFVEADVDNNTYSQYFHKFMPSPKVTTSPC